jgi:IS1 family transposase
MAALQCGQTERLGFIIDFEEGSRYMQTFKKLPMHMPKIKMIAMTNKLNMFYDVPS